MNPMHLGACATPITRSQFNPFTDGQGLFSTYMKWNGRTDLGHKGLKQNTIYRVISANVHSAYTELSLQEISTGFILPDDYNSVQFNPLQSYLGYAYAMPQIGERFQMIKVDPVNRNMEKWSTSPVQAMEQVGTNTLNIITMNSVYTVQIVTR